jgi:hypothetical protein
VSAYGNPQPYGSVGLERDALAGRLKVARGIARRAHEAGNQTRAASWDAVCDELLDHLPEVEARAITAMLDEERSA